MRFETIASRFQSVADELGLDFGYAPFKKGEEPQTPYIAFSYPYRNDFACDNKPYVRISKIRVILVTDAKEIDLEEAVEGAFETLGIQYSKDSDFDQEENVYYSTYETEDLIDG